ncbi:hypothetical protein AHF37_09002 [Paragonimus kellicotti]|nr:hypothetical protein AHF37_09002 [Paragonimus kellicotti]
MVRSCSARFSRNAIISVIGAVSPKSSHSTSSSGFKRAQSERFKTTGPQWIPPGSHDLNSNGATTDGRVGTERSRPASSRDIIVTDRRIERRPHTTPRTFISEFLTQKPLAQNKGVSKGESDMFRPKRLYEKQ